MFNDPNWDNNIKILAWDGFPSGERRKRILEIIKKVIEEENPDK